MILVGSMWPATGLSTDGPANIYEAVQVATDQQSKGRGVLVVMNEQIDGSHCTAGTASRPGSTTCRHHLQPRQHGCQAN